MTDYARLIREENPYQSLIQGDQAQALRGAMAGAAATQPDVEAKLRQLSKQVGVPLDSVRLDPPQAERQAAIGAIDYNRLVRENPITAGFLTEQAAVARDDVGTLTRIERAFSAFGQGIQKGSLQEELGPLHYKAMTGEITPAEQARRKQLNDQMKALDALPEKGDSPLSWFLNVTGYTGRQMVTSVKEAAPGALAGATAGAAVGGLAAPVAPVTATGGAILGARAGYITMSTVYNYKTEAGFAFDEFEGLKTVDGKPMPRDVAQGAAAAVGLLNAGLETVGELALLKLVPGLDKLMAGGAKQAVKTLLQRPTFRAAIADAGKRWMKAASIEGLTEGLQEITVILGRELAQGVAPGQFPATPIGQDVDRVLQATAEGAAGAAGVGAPATGVRAGMNIREVRIAQRNQDFMVALGESAQASKLRERLPEAFRDFVSKAREAGPVENVYIPADQFAKYFQSQNVDPAAVAAEVGAANFAEAAAAGTDVVIPLENYAEKLAATQHHSGLLQDVKLHQGDLTMREAKAMEQRQQELQAELEAMIDAESGKVAAPVVEQIKQEAMGELVGRYERGTADAYASTYAKAIASLAQRAGVDPMELHRQYGLRVVTPLPEILQQQPNIDTALDPLLDRLRAGDLPTEAQAFGPSLFEFIRSRGGLQPVGETRAMDENVDRRAFQRKITQPDGMSLDTAMEAAVEAGYFMQRGDEMLGETDLLDALAEDVAGNRVFSPQMRNEQAAALREQLTALAQFIEQVGGDVANMDNAALKALILKAAQTPAEDGQQFDQSATIRSGRETLKKYGLIPGEKYKTRQVAAALEARQRAKYGLIEADDRSPEALGKIAKWMAEEVMFEMQHPEKSGVGWYSEKFQRALDVFGDVYPELKTDQNARNLLTALIAITSDGQKVVPNFAQAIDVYGNFRESGKFTTDRGHIRQDSIVNNLAKIQELHDTLGPEGMRDYLMQEATVSELKRAAAERGIQFSTQYQANIKLPMAALVFGPKLGAFYANLMGAHGYLTMDRWWSRTFNRYRGTLLSAPTKDGLVRFRALLAADKGIDTAKMSEDELLSATIEYRQSYEAKSFKNGTEIEKAANTIYKDAFEGLEDAPFNAKDRTFMLDAVQKARQSLKRRGVDMSIADIQAVLWYYEKRLYGELGARQTADISYEEAARKVAAAVADGGGDRSARLAALSDGEGAAVRDAENVSPGEEDFVEGDGDVTLFQSTATGRDGAQAPRLMAINNLSADNLLFADRMGGIAVPSIGVITDQGGGVEGFGEITLIGTKDLADPSAEPVFSSDAYTARFPKPEWPKAKSKDAQALIDSVRAIAKEFDDRALVDMTFDEMVNSPDAEKVIERWVSSQAAQAMFLREQGVDVTPVMRQKPTRSGFPVEVIEALRPVMEGLNIGMSANDIIASPQVAALPQAYAEAMTAYFAARGVAPEDSAKMIDRRASSFGYATIDRLLTDLSAKLGAQEVDSWETRKQLEPLINERAVEFKQWVEGKILPNFGEPFLKVGGKKVPYTLGNIVKAMTDTKVKGNEKTMTYGAGQVRAATSIKFSDIEQMREAAASSVVDVAEYEQAKKESEALLDAYRTSVVEFTKLRNWRGDLDTWEAMDASMRALAKWGTGKKRDAASLRAALRGEDFDVAQIPDDVIEQGIQAGNALLNAPVPYFEAKPQRAVKLNEFAGAVIPANASDKVREVLQRNGVPFVEYADQEQRMQAARDFAGQLSAQGNQGVLFQADDGDKRGFIQFGADRKFTIGLLEKADLSTFLHETGHFWLEVLGDLAERQDAAEQIKADYQTLLDWFGVKSRAEITVEHHEKFARANEAYLMEGKAPSAELRGIFQRFRAWLSLIYRSMKSLNVQLNDNVRGVLDRIYATDEEIEAAKRQLDAVPLFTTAAEAGMTEGEFAAYRKTVEAASEAAKEKLQGELMREYQRAREKWWKEQRAAMRLDVEAEVDATPVYQAFAALVDGKLPDGTPIKLSKDDLVRRYGEEYLKRLPRGFQRIYTAEGGTSVDVAAETLGFESGTALVEALVNMRPRKDLIEAETDARMAREYGDMMLDGTIAEEAMQAIHNEERAKIIAAELRALRRQQSLVQPVLAALSREEQQARRTALDLPSVAVFRAAAAGRIGQMQAKDINPHQYLLAERRASKAAYEAAAKKDYVTAATEKQRELMNHYLYLEATKARQEIDKVYDYMGRFQKAATREKLGKAGADYLDQIDAILERYEFKRVSMTALAKRQSLLQFVEQMESQGLLVNIPDALLDEVRRVNYREATVDELRAVRDTVKNIEHLATLKNKLLRKREAIEFDAVKTELIDSARDNFKPTGELGKPNRKGETVRDKGARLWKWFDAKHLKVEQLVEWLDGGKIDGPWARYLFDQAADAQTREYELHAMVTARLQELAASMPKEWREGLADKTGVTLPGIEGPVTRYTLLSLALNTGNASNLQRLRDGYGWSDATITSALGELTSDDARFVQGVWDTVNSLWPEIVALEKRVTGIAPPKVEATPVTIGGVEVAGGYFPLVYDSRLSAVGEKQAEATESVGQFLANAYGRARTDRGYTKQRVETLKAPVLLDFEQVLTSHLTRVIKDVSHREAIYSLNKILKDGEVKAALIETIGEEQYRELNKWVQVLVADRADTLHQATGAARLIMQFRTNMAIVTMGWKISTMMAQFAGFGPSADLVKPRYLTQALVDFNRYGPWSSHRETLTNMVYEKSGEMKFRSDTIERDVRDSLRRMQGDNSPLAAIRKTAFYLTAMADRQVTIPTWLGGYRQALAEGASEEAAVRAGDRAVRLSQGSGGSKDLAAVQRDNELMRLLTMYYSPFSVLYARLRDLGHTTRRVDDMPRAVARVLALVILPAVLGDLLAAKGPGDDEDGIWWAIRKALLYPVASIPVVRDLSSYLEAKLISIAGNGEMKFAPSFSLSPVVGAMDKVARTVFMKIPEAAQGQRPWDDVAWDTLEASGYVLGLPTAQVRITGEYITDVLTNQAHPESPQQALHDLLFKRPPERK